MSRIRSLIKNSQDDSFNYWIAVPLIDIHISVKCFPNSYPPDRSSNDQYGGLFN